MIASQAGIKREADSCSWRFLLYEFYDWSFLHCVYRPRYIAEENNLLSLLKFMFVSFGSGVVLLPRDACAIGLCIARKITLPDCLSVALIVY